MNLMFTFLCYFFNTQTVPACQNLYKNSFTYHCLQDEKNLPFDDAIQFLGKYKTVYMFFQDNIFWVLLFRWAIPLFAWHVYYWYNQFTRFLSFFMWLVHAFMCREMKLLNYVDLLRIISLINVWTCACFCGDTQNKFLWLLKPDL